MWNLRIEVKGMHCKSCQALITEELEDAGAQGVVTHLDAGSRTGVVECSTHLTEKEIARIIESAGTYTVTKTELR